MSDTAPTFGGKVVDLERFGPPGSCGFSLKVFPFTVSFSCVKSGWFREGPVRYCWHTSGPIPSRDWWFINDWKEAGGSAATPEAAVAAADAWCRGLVREMKDGWGL